MPWVKDFDMDEVTDRAMKVFWAKGYEATSLADLTKAMSINKGSFYNAFGSKKDLFTRALLKYDRENHQSTIRKLESIESPQVALKTLFDSLVAEGLADKDRKGCFLVNTALDLPNHSDDIRDLVTKSLGDLEDFFERLVLRAQTRGEADENLEARAVAKSLLAQVIGLRVLARGAFDVQGLRNVADRAVSILEAR